MKRYIYLVAIAILTILSGCYELDRAPFDQPSSSTFWQTESQCKQGIMGVYASLKADDYLGKQFILDINSDIGAGYDQYAAIQDGSATARTGFMNNKWSAIYESIQRANIAIRNVQNAQIDETVRNQMIGEAKFLRGLGYFYLVNYFGGVPIYDETTDINKDFNNLTKARSTEAQVYEQVIKDFTDAIEVLPASWPSADNGRATKGAAYAFRGKAYLYQKNYTNAISDMEEVLKPEYNYSLYPSFKDLFNKTGDASSEMIFSLINLGGTGNTYGMPFAWYAGTRSTYGSCWNNTVASVGLADMYEYTDGKPFDWDELFPGYTTDNSVKSKVWYVTVDASLKNILAEPAEAETIKDMWTKRDPRLAATIITPYSHYLGWVSNAAKDMYLVFAKNATGAVQTLNEANGFIRNNKGGWESYFWRKFVPEGDMNGAITSRQYTPINYPVMRLADLYLLLAEAYNEDGNQSKAVEYINKVRTRVGMPGINSGPAWLSATTKEEVFQRIFRERAFELANEGHRELDLRRWKLSAQLLSNKAELSITGKTMLNRKFNPDRDYLWPIPATEIEMNSSLTQNPGW